MWYNIGSQGDKAEAETSIDVFFSKDGAFSGLCLWAMWDGGEVVIEQCVGHDVPSCCVYQDGVDVVALTWDEFCEVKFFTRNTGWKATVRGQDYPELAARFVRLVLASGAEPEGLS